MEEKEERGKREGREIERVIEIKVNEIIYATRGMLKYSLRNGHHE